MRPFSGWVILDKPLGLGSTQAVGATKRNVREGGYAKTKVGHGGTLDPLATGVLPIALGEATKLCGRMLDATKIYEFTIGFGTQTDTLDLEGAVVETSDARPTLEAVQAVLPDFTGPIEQVPPKYSAIKVDGKRAYALARSGEEVVMKKRAVEILSLKVDETSQQAAQNDGDGLNEVTLIAHVSKGTYIRSLARDIAFAAGSVGHVTMLRRTKAGPFDLSHAISLDKLNEMGQSAALEDVILPIEAGLDDIPALSLTPDQAGRIRNGQVLVGIIADDGQYLARDDNDVPVALVALLDGEVRVIRGFNL